ncbi:MAG: PilZ domain-containing protein [Candidatus Omnitrophica bacterium]|nr:PilZ domain-containing protein [Candidatus Omnitrophota bacterium]
MRDRRRYKRSGAADRRKHPRSDGLVLVNYKVPDLGLEGKSSAFNISGTGVRISLQNKIRIGVTVEMEIFLPGDSKVIPAIGDAVWIQKAARGEMHSASIKFTVIAQKNRTRIIEYVDRKFQKYGQRNN